MGLLVVQQAGESETGRRGASQSGRRMNGRGVDSNCDSLLTYGENCSAQTELTDVFKTLVRYSVVSEQRGKGRYKRADHLFVFAFSQVERNSVKMQGLLKANGLLREKLSPSFKCFDLFFVSLGGF